MWFLVGPTAVGKSEIALELAARLNAEIITADSMQIYRGMDIGTAKPTKLQQAKVRHHLLDVVNVDETYDVARYRADALRAAQDIQKRGKRVLVVGGSGMYVRALRLGLFEGGERSPDIREKWLSIGEKKGMTYLHHILERVDPASAGRIPPTDTRRVVRALEHFEITGKPISAMQTQWAKVSIADVVVGLDRPRKTLHERCNARVLEMLDQGFLKEVKGLMGRLEKSPTASQAVGYKEALAHLQGKISKDEMVELIQSHTRQLAKRQLTWFRREHNLKWINIEDGQPTSNIASDLAPFYRS
jgi:tRNA dimethylallyltransferase